MKFTEKCMMHMEKYVSVKKVFTNKLNMGLLQQAGVKKTVYGVETHWLFSKE